MYKRFLTIILRRPLCFICLIFTILIYSILLYKGLPNIDLEIIENSTVRILGRVVDKEYKNDSQVFYLKKVTFCDDSNSQNKNEESVLGAICCFDQGNYIDNVPIGSYLMIEGKYQDFPNATNPGEFSLKDYYQIKGYHLRINDAVIIMQSEEYSWWLDKLWKIKKYFSYIYENVLSNADAAIIKAMLLGEKTDMDAEIKSLYQKSGISHILAISGLHISVLGMGLFKLFKKIKIPDSCNVFLCLLFAINYALLTGGGVSTVRAVVMFLFFLLAKLFRRTNDPLTALSVSALIVVILSPYYLFYSGFWLSYIAVLGILLFIPALTGINEERGHLNKKEKFLNAVKNAVLSGIGMSYFSMPVVLYFYYEYPTYSILLNLVVIPLMTILLYLGIIVLFLGMFSLKLGSVISIFCHYILAFYEVLCRFVQRLEHSTLIIGRPAIFQIIVFYLLTLSFIIICKDDKIKWREKISWKLMVMALAVSILWMRIPNGIEVTVLDVGQGDGIFIRDNNGKNYMIDGGSSSKNNLAKYQIVPFLKYKGVGEIEYWFITHPDLDHCSGLIELLEMGNNAEIKINNLVLPDAFGIEDESSDVLNLAKENGIHICFMSERDYLENNYWSMNCLFPEQNYNYTDVNDASLMLLMKYGEFSMLFTGDATEKSERIMLQNYEEGQIDLLKVGHHGSNTSSSWEFLKMLSPDVAIISSGKNNRYGHPHEDVLERLRQLNIQYDNTAEVGAITIIVNKSGYRIYNFCGKEM